MENSTSMIWSKMLTAVLPEHRHEAAIHFASVYHHLSETGIGEDELIDHFVDWSDYLKSDKMLSDLSFLFAKGWVIQRDNSLHLSLPELTSIATKYKEPRKLRRRKNVPLGTRMRVYARDNWRCWLCDGLTAEKAVVLQDHGNDWNAVLDHALPHSDGGSDVEDNLMTAHRWCNSVRGDGLPMNVIIQSVRVVRRIYHLGFSVEKLRVLNEEVTTS